MIRNTVKLYKKEPVCNGKILSFWRKEKHTDKTVFDEMENVFPIPCDSVLAGLPYIKWWKSSLNVFLENNLLKNTYRNVSNKL